MRLTQCFHNYTNIMSNFKVRMMKGADSNPEWPQIGFFIICGCVIRCLELPKNKLLHTFMPKKLCHHHCHAAKERQVNYFF